MQRNDKVFALVEVESMADYPSNRGGIAIIPVLMYADYNTKKKAQGITEADVRDRYQYHKASGRNKLVGVLGVYALKSAATRRTEMRRLKRTRAWKKGRRK